MQLYLDVYSLTLPLPSPFIVDTCISRKKLTKMYVVMYDKNFLNDTIFTILLGWILGFWNRIWIDNCSSSEISILQILFDTVPHWEQRQVPITLYQIIYDFLKETEQRRSLEVVRQNKL